MRPEQFGHYQLLQRLGRGGMAEVFLARAESVGGFEKHLAIKRLLPPYNTDKQIISMLGDEARLSVWLTHPSIVQVLDFGQVGQTYYIAMEYVEGCDLCDLIRPEGEVPGRALPLATGLYVMIQVAEALDYAHQRKNRRGEPLGIIHRDVSPHNVLISREGQVKLADFGLARASISVHYSAAGVIRGKFSYMPKEQARGKPIDHRIDLFAAGVTLYEVLTGVKPYTSSTLAQQLYQLEQPVPPPSAHVPEIPEEIDDITLQAMSPDPETRYSSAEDLARDLRDALTKLSASGDESERLASLVRKLTGSTPRVPAARPAMSLAELPIPEESLIGEALEEAREQARAEAPPTELALPALGSQEPPPLDEDEEGDTFQFGAGGAAAAPAEDPLDGLQTVALPPSTAAESLPPAALGRNGGGSRSRGPSLPAAAPLPRTEQLDADAGAPLQPLRTEEEPVREVSTAEQRTGLDTLQEERREDDGLEDARTIQRSPDQALAAFRRALDDRERRRREQERKDRGEGAGVTRLSLRATLVLAAAGLLLFGIGLALGRLLPRQGPVPSITLKKVCPEARPACPPCLQSATDAGVGKTAAEAGAGKTAGSASKRKGGGIVVRDPGAQGFLTVTTTAAARVYIDDRTQSLRAPVNELPLPPGVHRVRVYSEQHRTFSDTQWVTVKAGETATLSFTLD